MFENILQNTRKPRENFFGKLILSGMNHFHQKVATWAFQFLPLSDEKTILDIGCGGGKNIQTMLKNAPNATVYGLDYSPASVAKSIDLNRKDVEANRAVFSVGNVSSMTYENNFFDAITAFETIYFWQPIDQCLSEVFRILKPGGKFMIACETNDPVKGEMWTKKIDGMTIYAPETIKKLMTDAGFTRIEIQLKDEWICAIGEK